MLDNFAKMKDKISLLLLLLGLYGWAYGQLSSLDSARFCVMYKQVQKIVSKDAYMRELVPIPKRYGYLKIPLNVQTEMPSFRHINAWWSLDKGSCMPQNSIDSLIKASRVYEHSEQNQVREIPQFRRIFPRRRTIYKLFFFNPYGNVYTCELIKSKYTKLKPREPHNVYRETIDFCNGIMFTFIFEDKTTTNIKCIGYNFYPHHN